MSKFWGFIARALTSGSNASSKRLNGTYGFALVQLMILFIVVYDVIQDGTISELSVGLIKSDLYASIGLLGLGILDKFKQV